MGYDTYLEVGGRVALMWRKSCSSMPRFLFRHDQTHTAAVDSPDNAMHSFEVEYQATAGEVLQTLREGGLGWNSSVATYATIRQAVIPESELYVHDKFVPMIEKRAALKVPGQGTSDSGAAPDAARHRIPRRCGRRKRPAAGSGRTIRST